MYNLGDPYTSFEWFGTSLIVFIMKNGAGNRAAERNDQKHHGKSGPIGHPQGVFGVLIYINL
jgi:hypothetical protein